MAAKTYRREILLALHKGATITVEFVREGQKTKKVYRLSSNNRAIRDSVVEQMVEDGLIRAHAEGLPGFGEPQSYRLWRASEGGA